MVYSMTAQLPRKAGLMRAVADEHRQQFGAELKSLRQAKGLGLRQFAREIPVSPSHVCSLESGRGAQPSIALICRMAEVLEIPAIHLLAKAGKLPPPTMLAFWDHPAIPAILSTIPGMSLDDAQMFCQQVVAALRTSQTPLHVVAR
jgi:transcriptional regulator with XRE-family HTH domain